MSKTSRMNKVAKERDKQAPQSGKVENDHNKMGGQAATQKNEGKRTPESRNDRDTHIGRGNQTQSRQGGPSSGP
ncbi:MAG: hypothetical protein V4637_15435 [Pseudomonadota bacterium]